MAKGLVASSSSDTDVKQLRLGEMPNFPLFSKLPPELRHTIWDMAAEVGFEVNLEQSCRCSFKSGQVRLNVTSQLMHVLRQRLALLHACQEARSLLAPRYDAFPYKKLLPARSGSAVVYEGVVEALDDLCLRPSTSSRRHGIIGTHESRSGGLDRSRSR
ncbi:hypothetical protein PG999_008941 [Apiospora kogelbergensis]|uniref:2EXR domain-containing protein n=1 Tax=Apiospora kogelbergensis TaxID=1337665 RepID=A0AAW0QHT6_9PEZI